ncbi:MAG: sugar phosphate isomerase/epimerase [Candidatus Bathyarchaeota archaeon]|nr:sugar phosphate isomerase/epimerase [Candidatus Bathyarchaeota archaeon]
MSKLYVQPLCHDDLPDFVDFACLGGYNLEVASFSFANVYETNWQEVLEEHKRRLLGFGGEVSFHGVFQDLSVHSSDKRIWQVSKERIQSSLEVAQALNASKAVFHGNFNPFITDPDYKKNWVERNAEFWSQALDSFGGIILLENVWDALPDAFGALFEAVGSSRFKMCFDVGHANVYSKKPLKEWLSDLRSEIVYMHFSDNAGEADQHLEMGKGKIDWNQFTQELENQNMHPDVTLEMITLEKTKNSVQYMQKHAIYPFNQAK